uniref:Uncharacterized protein n=2 Tax=Oryza sativa subsp. japonica TaxID=39947 RepID=Q7XZY5_ORYSJ|nr:hypothetical protein [Oryza sativa Japonica Group]ABF97933.1 hypothetical protein LOC_Os03g44930 [Oryza sativa Japonica Group]
MEASRALASRAAGPALACRQRWPPVPPALPSIAMTGWLPVPLALVVRGSLPAPMAARGVAILAARLICRPRRLRGRHPWGRRRSRVLLRGARGLGKTGMGGTQNQRYQQGNNNHVPDDPYSKMSVEQKFSANLVPDQYRVRQATTEFKEFAYIWWVGLDVGRALPTNWKELKFAMLVNGHSLLWKMATSAPPTLKTIRRKRRNAKSKKTYP